MKPGLSDRLSRLKKARKEMERLPPQTPRGDNQDPIPSSLKGEWSSPADDLWVKKRICPSPLADFESSSLLHPDYPEQEKWLFYDTETTGLSGGAGNIAFLVGIGRALGNEFHITQYFLKDYPGEPALLNLLKEEIEKSSLFISYNGKSFDKPLLETRFLMNRVHCTMGDQLDLLYPVRSLFKRSIPNCRLGSVEEHLLGINREDDIPGADIPDIWFSFLKEGDHPDLNRVLEHNDMDILSLAVLLKKLESFLIHPAATSLRDSCALGRFLLDRGDERGVVYLEEAVEHSDPSAEYHLIRLLKRRGEWERVCAVWDSILERRLSPFAAVEKAKYLEHRLKNYREALILVDRLLRELPSLPGTVQDELVHRRKRLLGKEKRRIESPSSGGLE